MSLLTMTMLVEYDIMKYNRIDHGNYRNTLLGRGPIHRLNISFWLIGNLLLFKMVMFMEYISIYNSLSYRI